MTALYIIFGVVAFFLLLLSVPVVLDLEYTDAFKCKVSWSFIRFNIYPQDEKKKKKEKPPKEDKKPKEEPKPQQETSKPEKPKKDNFIKTFYNNQGVLGIIEVVQNCAAYLGKFSKGFLKSIYIRKLKINISVTESDAAQTAIRYGKICQEIYPPLGFICSSCHVKNYSVNIWANYCGEKTKGEFETRVALVPRSVINAGIALVFRLGWQLLKVLLSNKKAKNNENINTKGGQTQ